VTAVEGVARDGQRAIERRMMAAAVDGLALD